MTTPRTLVVTAHPDPASLTHRAAAELLDLLPPGSTEVAHLAQEGFDPRFTLSDHLTYRGLAPTSAAVQAEQRRVDAADHVVLVFPVHWWSFPALLKGWVDRVLIAGWAFDPGTDGRIAPRLQDRTLHLLPLAGATADSWGRRGYDRAFATQVEVGIAGFCGMRTGVTAFVHDSEADPGTTARAIREAAAQIAAGIDAGARRSADSVTPASCCA
ncbi:NAD(P)H dehydrogenase (quinone) [Klenkia marina]|uniref:NAD(P)H dehydrogenase (Quinone) n=1 Tax=Klenkia marina TaxID=1960309 RepID=A0A1G4XVR7_9ACTN|nr:NAD(P)H-dependent oxidoreductase [Klenkia marina]SCX45269.1 NAD(P)H dehydrogenase (quinone) [Klenkia marina]